MIAFAVNRGDVADYVSALFYVYILIIFVYLTLSLFYHMANGIRHIIFDSGRGFDLKWADFGAAFAFTFAIVISVLVWVFAAFTGAF